MARLIDLTGQTFGAYTVLRRLPREVFPSGQGQTVWLCRCQCGAFRKVQGLHLRHAKGLGCPACSRAARATRVVDGVPLRALAKAVGLTYGGLASRYALGLRGDELLQGRKKGQRYRMDGEVITRAEAAKRLGITVQAISRRLLRGVPPSVALTQPRHQG